MLLKSPDDSVVELVVRGYEFPDVRYDYWDSNWLVIEGRVSAGIGSWRFTHPCGRTFEWNELATWLEGIQFRRPVEPLFEFTEPLVTFQLIDRTNEAATIRIVFDLEATPHWRQPDDGDCFIDLLVFDEVLEEAVRSIHSDLKRFPIR